MARAMLSGSPGKLGGSASMLRGGTGKQSGGELPLPASVNGIVRTPLPNDTAVSTRSAVAVQALVDQANASGTYAAGANAPPSLNTTIFGVVYRVVGLNQPYLKVAVTQPRTALEADAGYAMIPIPADLIPQGDTDSTVVIYQPAYPHGPSGSLKGRMWELTGCYLPTPQQASQGYAFQTRNLSRRINADNDIGRAYDYFWQVGATFDQPATDPFAVPDQREGIMQYRNTDGASALGGNPPFVTLCIKPDDMRRGYATHPLGLVTCNHGKGSIWPGIIERFDGTLATYPFRAGDWFRYPASATMPTNLSPMGEVLWRTIQRYGLIVWDKTLSCLAIRAMPECGNLLVGPNQSIDGRDWTQWTFQNFPWGSMELTVPGSDNEYHPRATNKVTTGIGSLATWELWLEAQRETASNNTVLTKATDWSGKGRHAFKPPDRNGATFKTGVQNGQAAFEFNATGFSFPAFYLDDDFTIFVAHQTSGDSIMVGADTGYGQLARQGDPYALGGDRYLFSNDDPSYADVSSTPTSTARTNWSILEVHRSAGVVSWYESGTARGTGTLATPVRAGTVFWVPTVSTYLAPLGRIGTILITASNLSVGVSSSVRAALGAQYGITVV